MTIPTSCHYVCSRSTGRSKVDTGGSTSKAKSQKIQNVPGPVTHRLYRRSLYKFLPLLTQSSLVQPIHCMLISLRMAKRSQIHIFLGAPVIPEKLESSEELYPPTASGDIWRKTHIVYDSPAFNLAADNTKWVDGRKRSVQSEAAPAEAKDEPIVMEIASHLRSQSERPSRESDSCSVSPRRIGGVSGCNELLNKETVQLLAKSDMMSTDQCAAIPSDANMIDNYEKEAVHLKNITDLVSSTENICIEHCSEDQDNVCSPAHNILNETLSQYLDSCFTSRLETQRSDGILRFELSTEAEYLSIMTASKVAVHAKRQFLEQPVLEGLTIEKGTKTGQTSADRETSFVKHPSSNGTGRNTIVVDQGLSDESSSSLDLFSPMSEETLSSSGTSCFDKHIDCHEKSLPPFCTTREPQSRINAVQPFLSMGSSKRIRMEENMPRVSKKVTENLQGSKKAKWSSSTVNQDFKIDPNKSLPSVDPSKRTVLLGNCSCNSLLYHILVAVIHPCHLKEVQSKSGPLPLATIVVVDQSDVERKVVLWRSAAFWTLTVSPGDVILITVSHIVDVASLQGLLAHLSSCYVYLTDLPARKPQNLDCIQHVRYDELQPDTLVHSLLKVIGITIVTESIYLFKGKTQKKVILTVEQMKGKHGTLVLWGTGTLWQTQIQRKRDHIWEFRNVFARRNTTSGDIELHTTPWSSCECLFEDDKRALEFKANYQKPEAPPPKIIDIASVLEEKYSGVVQVRAHISQLRFTMGTHQIQHLILDSSTSLEWILESLPEMIYSGCGKCSCELKTDENMIYQQCYQCLPFNQVKVYYRPAILTVFGGESEIQVHVLPQMVEKIFLNIPPHFFNRRIVSSSEVTYGMVVADLCYSLLCDSGDSYQMTIRSVFELDDNSMPLQRDFHLLEFLPDL
ncbi:shieldin complex subunit 2 isoform X2 [Ambystoma mexicanum]|uniref:shieldin complex subunit 2 isoform X2 n=1 Tax=Ambystoma mexicanum TaxID=8296 RepID=UPI0037E70753